MIKSFRDFINEGENEELTESKAPQLFDNEIISQKLQTLESELKRSFSAKFVKSSKVVGHDDYYHLQYIITYNHAIKLRLTIQVVNRVGEEFVNIEFIDSDNFMAGLSPLVHIASELNRINSIIAPRIR